MSVMNAEPFCSDHFRMYCYKVHFPLALNSMQQNSTHCCGHILCWVLAQRLSCINDALRSVSNPQW